MENKLPRRKLYTRKRVLWFALFMLPIALTLLWSRIDSDPHWAIQSWGISWQTIAIFASFIAMSVWVFLDKKGVWDEK
jgi:hypothetical protein